MEGQRVAIRAEGHGERVTGTEVEPCGGPCSTSRSQGELELAGRLEATDWVMLVRTPYEGHVRSVGMEGQVGVNGRM